MVQQGTSDATVVINQYNGSNGASSSVSVSVDASDATTSGAIVSINTEVDSIETSEIDAPAGSRSSDEAPLIGYCYCGQGEDYDDMICCDLIGWFHFSCLKITKKDVPKGKYYCPDCHKLRSTERSKSNKTS